MEQTITDVSHYRKEMAKSMVDKLFFIDQIDVNLIVDFGCADGTMLSFIQELRPDIQLIGYDISQEMIDIANNNKIWNGKNKPIFTSDWTEIKNIIQNYKSEGFNCSLTLSSVIHEVYSYGDEKSVAQFWSDIFNTDFDYIVIRDMLLSKKSHHESQIRDVEKVYSSHDPHIQEFESLWGSITDYKNLLHFLFKYRYNKNWFRELRENYLPITLEDMLSHIPTDLYSYDYYDHYVLPFIEKSVKKEFGITLKEQTHIKLILKKK
jgi:SAM-dependent methyltransferase